MGAIQTPFDFHLRTPQSRADFFAWHAQVISIPADGVIVGHRASYAHAEDFLEARSSMASDLRKMLFLSV